MHILYIMNITAIYNMNYDSALATAPPSRFVFQYYGHYPDEAAKKIFICDTIVFVHKKTIIVFTTPLGKRTQIETLFPVNLFRYTRLYYKQLVLLITITILLSH